MRARITRTGSRSGKVHALGGLKGLLTRYPVKCSWAQLLPDSSSSPSTSRTATRSRPKAEKPASGRGALGVGDEQVMAHQAKHRHEPEEGVPYGRPPSARVTLKGVVAVFWAGGLRREHGDRRCAGGSLGFLMNEMKASCVYPIETYMPA